MAINDILTTISAISAAIAAIASCVAIVVSHAQYKKVHRPHISVYLEPYKNVPMYFLNLVVRNDGNGVARNIRFSVSGDEIELNYQYQGKTNIKDLNFIKSGISVLPQEKEKSYYLVSIQGKAKEFTKKRVIIGVKYTDSNLKEQYTDEFILDFESLAEIKLGGDTVTKELKAINKTLKEVQKHK